MYTYEDYKKSADYLLARAGGTPQIGVILGSGLGGFASALTDTATVDYADIPNFLVSTAASHAGKMVFGNIGGKRVACMSGRFHYYEGYDFGQLAIPVRVMKLLGVRAMLLTNAAGAVNASYRVGDIMIIRDHIKLAPESPMRGKNLDEFGPRFFDVTRMYTPELRALALECAKGSGLTVHEGVYFYFAGPQFETPAEIRAARILGGDAVGMSTVTEALTAAHCSMPLLALSVITNMAAGVVPGAVDGGDVVETARSIEEPFAAYVKKIISRM